MTTALGCRLSVLASPTASRYKDANLKRCNKPNRVACKSNLRVIPILSSSRNLQQPNHNWNGWASAGLPSLYLSATSSTFLMGERGSQSHKLPVLLRQRKSSTLAQSKKNNSVTIPFPKMEEKPDWWWRTLACLPYLIALQMSYSGHLIQPFVEHYQLFGDLVYYVPGAIKRLPEWFTVIYFWAAYFGVVKKKEWWPHFFRYHVIMAMLLETTLQAVEYSSNFFPLIHFDGTFGIEYWAAVSFTYIFILLECIRCALGGKYVKLPVFSTTALVHTLFHVEGYHKPF